MASKYGFWRNPPLSLKLCLETVYRLLSLTFSRFLVELHSMILLLSWQGCCELLDLFAFWKNGLYLGGYFGNLWPVIVWRLLERKIEVWSLSLRDAQGRNEVILKLYLCCSLSLLCFLLQGRLFPFVTLVMAFELDLYC